MIFRQFLRTAILTGLVALFTWRVYRTPIPYGWMWVGGG